MACWRPWSSSTRKFMRRCGGTASGRSASVGTDPALLEGRGVVDMRRYPFLVERVDQFLVDQDIGPASLVLEALDLGDQAAVMREKRRARLEFALHQRCADEDLARRARLDR